MKHLYNARDYFKSFFLPHSSSLHSDSLGFVSESYYSATGHDDKGSFSDVLISVCIYRNAQLRLVFNHDMGCTNGVCNTIKEDVARKFNIPVNHILTQSGKMRQAAPGQLQLLQETVLEPGQAIGHEKLSGYGTLGSYSIDYQKNTVHHIVSNNHVLANSNQGRAGDGIFSRGHGAQRRIATLQNSVPIRFGGEANYLDIAAASVDFGEQAKRGDPMTNRIPQVGDRVYKIGATTGLRYGVIDSLEETVPVTYGNQVATFENQILISGINEPFSQPGDSGSFIYDSNSHFVGLLFAGQGNETNANHGHAVMQQLREWQIVR